VRRVRLPPTGVPQAGFTQACRKDTKFRKGKVQIEKSWLAPSLLSPREFLVGREF
jgi:hypothetical protein